MWRLEDFKNTRSACFTFLLLPITEQQCLVKVAYPQGVKLLLLLLQSPLIITYKKGSPIKKGEKEILENNHSLIFQKEKRS